jgi:hypothetical protein
LSQLSLVIYFAWIRTSVLGQIRSKTHRTRPDSQISWFVLGSIYEMVEKCEFYIGKHLPTLFWSHWNYLFCDLSLSRSSSRVLSALRLCNRYSRRKYYYHVTGVSPNSFDLLWGWYKFNTGPQRRQRNWSARVSPKVIMMVTNFMSPLHRCSRLSMKYWTICDHEASNSEHSTTNSSIRPYIF